MKRLGTPEDGHLLTTGEKALLVMVVAGMLGYWAGFNVSTPSLPDPFPVAAAAAPALAPERLSVVYDSVSVDPAAAAAAKADEPPVPTF
jgi:hypothetical protein